jgi:hypothetical protein
MNCQEPLRISSIDFSKVVYPKVRANQNKKIILIKYNEKSKLKNFVFQTPTLLNLSKPVITNGYAEIEVALVGKEKLKVDKFIKFLNDLENKVKADAQFNASSWFNITDENQTINFQKIIRESDDYSTGTIKIKIIKNNDFETMVQLNNNKRIGIESIPEDSWCKMILECYAVWVNTNNDFGLFFRPVLTSFTPREKQTYNYRFIEDSDEENENEFDIPDTDINHNIFMKIERKNRNKLKSNESTSQLDLQELVNHLESEEQPNTSDIKLSIININVPGINANIKENFLVLDTKTSNFSDSTSSDSEPENEFTEHSESTNTRLVDAETSDN